MCSAWDLRCFCVTFEMVFEGLDQPDESFSEGSVGLAVSQLAIVY